KTGAVTLIQRFGSALNLNLHFHMLFLDGVYVERPDGRVRFRWVKAPLSAELTQLADTIAHRVGRYLERQGLLERDAEHSYLAGEDLDDDPMSNVLGHSITYRIAVGPNRGRKVMTLQTLPADEPPFGEEAGKVSGFSLHAGVAARADQRDKLERLCRYISRPAVSEKRLSLTNNGLVRYQLKTPYRDGTTHVFFEPLDFLARLAALARRIDRDIRVAQMAQMMIAARRTYDMKRFLAGLDTLADERRQHTVTFDIAVKKRARVQHVAHRRARERDRIAGWGLEGHAKAKGFL
ncbi:transposase, partial [Salinisphaera orenii YIM 95161]